MRTIDDLEGTLRSVLVQYERAMHELGWTMVDLRAKDTLALLVERARREQYLLADLAEALDMGYWDVTTDKWRCTMCDAAEGHAEGCSHGKLLARVAAPLGD